MIGYMVFNINYNSLFSIINGTYSQTGLTNILNV